MSREFKIIETQEQFDEAISSRIGALQAKHSEATAELQKQIEALTAENADLNKSITDSAEKYKAYDETLADLQGKIKGYELKDMKLRVASEIGLDHKAIAYLSGDTEEEIRANAEGLASLIPKKIAPVANPEPTPTNSEEQALKAFLKSMN